MKLYYTPFACSLSDHIALLEAGAKFERVKVDLKTKRTETGDDYLQVNPKGYVPALTLDTGETLTENVAILDWIAREHGSLMPDDTLGRTRQIEALAYISDEIHKAFTPFNAGGSDDEKRQAEPKIRKRLQYFEDHMGGDYLFGDRLAAADCYLFVMSLWARKQEIPLPAKLDAFVERMMARPAVRAALKDEGLL